MAVAGTTTPRTAARRIATTSNPATATTTWAFALRVQAIRPMYVVQGRHACAQGLSSPVVPVPALSGQRDLRPRRLVALRRKPSGALLFLRLMEPVDGQCRFDPTLRVSRVEFMVRLYSGKSGSATTLGGHTVMRCYTTAPSWLEIGHARHNCGGDELPCMILSYINHRVKASCACLSVSSDRPRG